VKARFQYLIGYSTITMC